MESRPVPPAIPPFFHLMKHPISTNYRILISVRNMNEARIAAQAGVSLIDVKEPARGSLGMVDLSLLREIAHDLRQCFPHVQLSAAGGELKDFLSSPDQELFPPLAFYKLGLSGLRSNRGWVQLWEQARARFFEKSSPQSPPPGWIAVAYVDDVAAEAPAVADVVAAAIDCRCAGVLFDTFEKTGRRLPELLPVSQLETFLERLHQHGLLGAVAGQLRLEDLTAMRAAGADIIAFRSAACRNRDRTAELDAESIRHLLDA